MENKYTVLGFVIMLSVIFLGMEGLIHPMIRLSAFAIGILISLISSFKRK